MYQFKNLRALRTAVALPLMLAAGSVFAAVPEEVTAALGTLKVDTTTISSLSFSVFLIVVMFKYFRRGAA